MWTRPIAIAAVLIASLIGCGPTSHTQSPGPTTSPSFAPAAPAVGERTLIALGFLPAGSSLRALVLDLESGQVAGYYSPQEKQLFVVSRSGGIGPTQRSTYAHEFTHELQDQHFNLKSLGFQAPDQADRSLARLAMVEGDAVSVQTSWMQQHFGAADLTH